LAVLDAARHAAARPVATALLILAALAIPASADQTATVRAHLAALSSAESRALLDLYAADSALANAQTRLAALQADAQTQARLVADATRGVAVGKANLTVARDALQARVVDEFRAGGVDPLALVLGAGSLGQALDAYTLEQRLSSHDASLVAAVESGLATQERERRQLADGERRLAVAVTGARVQRDQLVQVTAQKQTVVASLRAQEQSDQTRIVTIEAAAQAAQQKATQIQQQASSVPSGSGSPPPTGSTGSAGSVSTGQSAPPPGPRQSPTGSLTVVATAYSGSGTTATGIPTAPGVCAVDPRVIPLGTRFAVPGYGECVAADTGGAITGDRIDVWVATQAQANAWGVQTVTITIQ
jgi:3D (Asp-Asp-Asp) domain-containing protein